MIVSNITWGSDYMSLSPVCSVIIEISNLGINFQLLQCFTFNRQAKCCDIQKLFCLDKNTPYRTFLVVQQLRIYFQCRAVGLIPGLGMKIPHAMRQQEKLMYCSRDPQQKNKKKKQNNPQETNKTHPTDISPISICYEVGEWKGL